MGDGKNLVEYALKDFKLLVREMACAVAGHTSMVSKS